MLEETLQKYHNRLIDAAAVVKAMLEIKKEMDADQERAKELHMEDDELAFYDAVAENYATIYDQQFLCDLIHDVVQTIKKNLKVDWTEPHREDVKAAVRAAVRRVLRRRGVKEEDFEPFLVQDHGAGRSTLWRQLLGDDRNGGGLEGWETSGTRPTTGARDMKEPDRYWGQDSHW